MMSIFISPIKYILEIQSRYSLFLFDVSPRMSTTSKLSPKNCVIYSAKLGGV